MGLGLAFGCSGPHLMAHGATLAQRGLRARARDRARLRDRVR